MSMIEPKVFRLTTESLDDDRETTVYASKAEAIDAAASWFADGYEGDEPEWLAEEVERLRSALAANEEYRCGAFYEHVTLTEHRVRAALGESQS